MKNKIIFIILVILLVIFLGIVVTFTMLFKFLNKEKESITAIEFKTLMSDKGFTILDVTNQFSKYNYVKQAYIATPSDNSYEIEFYELYNDEYAINFYNHKKSIIESSKEIPYSKAMSNMKNYSKYAVSTFGKYKVVSRINNTVVNLKVNVTYKESVKNILKELEY